MADPRRMTPEEHGEAHALLVKVVTDPLNVIFKPSLEGQVGYYARTHDFAGTRLVAPDPGSASCDSANPFGGGS